MQKYKGNQLSYEKGADLVGRTEFVLKLQLTQLIEVAAVQTAKTADVVIMNLGARF
jgi:hypothetical protein